MDPMQIMAMLSRANNPMAMMQQLVGNNPTFQRALQMGQGKSEEELKVIIKNLAAQRGMSVEQLNSIINQFGLKL